MISQNETARDQNEQEVKRGKKQKRKFKEWKKVRNKTLSNSGKSYLSSTGKVIED